MSSMVMKYTPMCRPMTPTAGAMILDFAAIVLYRPMKFIARMNRNSVKT